MQKGYGENSQSIIVEKKEGRSAITKLLISTCLLHAP